MPLSRMPTMALTIGFTVIPLFFSHAWILVLAPVYPSLFEGVVHVAGVKLTQQPKPCAPGMVTTLAEFVLGAARLTYLIAFCPVAWWEYLAAVVRCFAFMQSCLTKLMGMRYRGLPKLMKARLEQLRGS